MRQACAWTIKLWFAAASLALGTTFFATAPARAATLTWWATGSTGTVGGAGTWDTSSARWTANGSTWSTWTNPTSPPDTAVFGGPISGAVTLSTGITVGGLTFNTTNYTISGSTLTLTGGTAAVTVSTTSGTATVSSIVAGTSMLQKAGSGTLWLSATNSYTGGTILNSGILQFSTNSLGPSGTVTLNGGTLRWSSGNTQDIFSRVVLASGSTATLDTFFNSISTSANLGTAGNTASLVKTGGGVLTLNGSTLYTGSTSIAQGTLVFGTSAAKGTGTVTVSNDATLGLRMNAGFTTADFVNLQANSLGGVSMGSAAIAGIDTNGVDTTINTNLGGTVGVAKMGAGKLTLTGTLTYAGPTAIDAGSLAFGTNYASTNQLRFGSTGGVTTSGTLDLSTTSGTFGSMLVQINSSSNTATALIGSGKTLAINGNVTIGFDNLAPAFVNWAQTRFAASGSGTFAQVVTGGTFQLAVAAAYNRNPSVADFSNLATLVINHGTTSGAVIIGEDNVMNDPSQSILSLAANSTITTNLIHVGRGANNDTTIRTLLHLGTSSNILNANTLNIGGTSGAARNSATIDFLTASGSVQLRAADGVGRTTVNVLNDPATSTSGDMAGTLDTSGHYADLLIGALTIGVRGNTSRGYGSGALAFDGGKLDATTVVMAVKSGSGSGRSTAAVTLGGGTTTFGSLTMSVNTSSVSTTTSGTLSFSGGSLSIGTGSGTAINMATAVAGGTANSLISLTGGTATISGNIVRSGSAGTESATLLLDGSRLNMSGFAIGTAAAGITLDLRSGALENLGEYNGGGGLTKTTSGTLTLYGSNSYTAGTQVSAGVLAFTSTGALGSGTVTLGGGLLQTGFAGAIANPISIAVASGTFDSQSNANALSGAISGNGGFVKVGSGTLTLSASNAFTGTTRVGAGTLIAGTAAALSASTLDMNSADAGSITFNQNSTLGGLTGSRDLDMGGRTLSIGNNGQGTTYSGVLSNGSLTKVGSGTLTLTGSNAYAGSTAISAGRLTLTGNGMLGSGSYAGAIFNAGELFVSSDTNQILSGTISGAGSLIKQGNGTLTLSGVNTTYSGTTMVNGGLVTSDTATTGVGLASLGAGPIVIGASGTVQLTGSNGGAAGGSYPNYYASGYTNTVSGSGTLRLFGQNSGFSVNYSGDLSGFTGTVSATAVVGKYVGYGSSTTPSLNMTGSNAKFVVSCNFLGVLGATGTLALGELSGNSVIYGNLNYDTTWEIGGLSTSSTFSGRIANNAWNTRMSSLRKVGSGTLTLSGSSNYSGGTQVSAGVLAFGNVNALGSGTVTLGGGTLRAAVSGTVANPVAVANAASVIDTNARVVTLSGVISGAGGITTADTSGTAVLAGNNTFTGDVIIASNTATAVTAPSVVVVTRDTSLGTGNKVVTLRSSGRTLVLDGSGGNITLGGNISYALSNEGSTSGGNPATPALRNVAGDNTVSGVITLWSGGGGTLIQSDAGSLTLAGDISANNSGSQRQLILDGVAGGTISGAISDGIGGVYLSKRGAGAWSLTGTNTFTGVTTMIGGVLLISSTDALQRTSGVDLAGGAGLSYTGGMATFDRNVTLRAGSGTGTITNSGGGLLTLSGALSKDNSVLRLTGGAFNVTGLITGTTVGASDLVVDAASVTLSNTNTYNGPTYVYNSGTLTLGITNAIPATSVVTLGNGTSAGTLQLNGYTDSIGGLAFGAGGGTLRLSAASTSAAPLTATTGTMTLTNGTLDLAGSGSTAGLYRVLSAQSIAGSFASVTGTSVAYQVVTTSTSVEYQQKAVLGTVMVTNPAVSIITGGSAGFTYTVANTALSGGASLSFTGTGLSNVAGLSSGSAMAAGTSGATPGMFFTGTLVGSRQGTFTVNAPTAFGSTSVTGTVTVNVLDHSNAVLSLASGGGQTIITGGSFATVGFNLTNTGTNRAAVQVESLTNLTGGTGSAVVLSGGTASYTGTIVDSISVGSGTLSVSMLAGDQQNLSGASNLSTLSASATYTVLDHATSSLASSLLTSTTISLGTWNYLTHSWESGTNSALFSIHNIKSSFSAALTADLWLLGVSGTGSGFSTNLDNYSAIVGGNSSDYSIFFDPTGLSTKGTQSTTFMISLGDPTGLSGASASHTLDVTAVVSVVPEPSTYALALAGLACGGFSMWRRRKRA